MFHSWQPRRLVAHQAPLSMGLSRQEPWSEDLLQGIFLAQGSSPHLLHLLQLAGGFFTTNATWEALNVLIPQDLRM